MEFSSAVFYLARFGKAYATAHTHKRWQYYYIMKLNLLTFFTLSLLFSISYSQNNPSEKETFNFIVFHIKTEVVNDVDREDRLENIKSDFENATIEFEKYWTQAPGSEHEFLVTNKYVLDFNKIESVKISKIDDIKTDYGWSMTGYWKISIKFKEKGMKIYSPKYGDSPPNIIYEDVRWDSERGYKTKYEQIMPFYFRLEDEKSAKRFEKAVKHYITLKTGINTSLFDE